VRDLLHFDPVTRDILVQTAARDPAISPYYRDICKINIDSCLLTPLVTGNFDHEVVNKNSFSLMLRTNYDIDNNTGIGIDGVSPGGEFIVVTRARVDTIPVSFIIDKNGQELFTVETTDVSGLPEGWHWPEPVKLKAADNQTDIYGVVFRPPHFSPDDHYPILEYSSSMRGLSALPQGPFSLGAVTGYCFYQPAALAALGFIVVMIEGRGTPLRNKAFQDHRFGEFAGTSDLDDRMAGIRQLAKRYTYMDINRVGITTTEIPNNAIYGLLHPSDFYSVVVLHCFNDPRYNLAIMGETQDGTIDQAVINNNSYPENYLEHFSGKLFLIQGMMTTGVPGAFRLVEALQKANLTFDMLYLPNLMNQMTAYTIRREWDYLVTHLQGGEPPRDFKLTTGEDLFHLNKHN
jgi:dipeptidyl aminopeptidase/acylaminoacyl peptidase